eukprot:3825057-Rhodomonas_salina.5
MSLSASYGVSGTELRCDGYQKKEWSDKMEEWEMAKRGKVFNDLDKGERASQIMYSGTDLVSA